MRRCDLYTNCSSSLEVILWLSLPTDASYRCYCEQINEGIVASNFRQFLGTLGGQLRRVDGQVIQFEEQIGFVENLHACWLIRARPESYTSGVAALGKGYGHCR